MDLISYTKYFAALAAIIILLLVIAYIFKKMSQKKPSLSAKSNDIFNSKSSSLFLQEVLPIDQKTKIIIVGRDNIRHVILLSENHSTLIETVSPESSPQEAKEFVANAHVGSISLGTAAAAEPLQVAPLAEPIVSNIMPEKAPNEPMLTSNIHDLNIDNKAPDVMPTETKNTEIEAKDNAPKDTKPKEVKLEDADTKAKSAKTQAQVKDDLQSETKPDKNDLTDIKNKLQDAKALAEPSKD